MKVVINNEFGGYGLSSAAIKRWAEIKGIKLFEHDNSNEKLSIAALDPSQNLSFYKVPYEQYKKVYDKDEETGRGYTSNKLCFDKDDIKRDDPALIQVIKELGDKAGSRWSKLKIINIPDGTDYEIDEYDGMETIHEKHKSWR